MYKAQKKNRNYTMFISAKSLAQEIEKQREDNDGKIIGLEFWINKESDDRKSKYIINP